MKPLFLLSAVVLIALTACARAPKRLSPASAAPQEATRTASQGEPDVRAAAFRSLPELATVSFGYDSASLSEPARAALRANAAWLAEHPAVVVQVSGHCDQRGTEEYNLALGQRRAAAVRDYYRLLGTDASRVATISFGRERPVCAEATDLCFARNRRAETLEALAQTVGRSLNQP